jgi:transposase
MNQVSTVGLDLAKYIFQLHGADSAGAVVFRQKLRRGQLLAFLATLPPCTVAMEACGSAPDVEGGVIFPHLPVVDERA